MSIASQERRRLQPSPPVEKSLAPLAEHSPPSVFQSRPWWKPLISAWLLYHVVGIALYPAAILVPARGLLSTVSNLFYERYMEGLYMVQGHRFFAPEPGPGTLIAYRIERSDGSVEENSFPRRDIAPRLLYHRYFMLSERVQDVGDEPEWYRMYARHLAHEFGGERVQLWRVVHRLATPDDIAAGKHLNDDEFYDRRDLGDWSRAELDQPWNPLPEPSAIEDDANPTSGVSPEQDAAATEETDR
ncbi:MAG: hypothetical protein ACK5Q5_11780 [Planctomycetaceae bacterium]